MRKRTFFFFAGLFGFILAIMGFRIDNDTWYLLALGRAIAAGGLTPGDPIFMDLGYPVVNQQWLYVLGLWKVFSLSGFWGIYFLSVAAGFLSLVIFYRLACLLSEEDDLIPYLLTGIIGVLYGYLGIVVRPWVFSNLVFMAEAYLLEHYAREKRVKLLFPLLLFSVLLINLHGALWPFLLILMLPYLAEALLPERLIPFCLPTRSFPKRPLVLCFFLCLLLGFANPYGLDLMLYSTRAQGIGGLFRQISEVQPLTLAAPYGVIMMLMAGWLFFCFSRQRTYLRYLLLSLGTCFMMLMSVRSSTQFLLLGCLPIAWLCRGVSLSRAKAFLARHVDPVIFSMFAVLFLVVEISYASLPAHLATGLPVAAYLLGALVLVLFLRLFFRRAASLPWKAAFALLSLFFGLLPLAAAPGFDPAHMMEPEVRAALSAVEDDAQKSPAEIRLYTDFASSTMAEYLGFHPLIDTRPELRAKFMTHGFDYWKEYSSVQQGMIDPLAYLDRYDIECVVVGKKDVLYYALAFDAAQEKWALFYEGKDYRVFCRR